MINSVKYTQKVSKYSKTQSHLILLPPSTPSCTSLSTPLSILSVRLYIGTAKRGIFGPAVCMDIRWCVSVSKV